MTQTELTRMKVWLIEHTKKYLVQPSDDMIYYVDLANDFYNHFKNEITA